VFPGGFGLHGLTEAANGTLVLNVLQYQFGAGEDLHANVPAPSGEQ
jgi:hypothetical protein